MRAALMELLEADGTVTVADLVSKQGVGELINEVKVRRLAMHRKCGVTRPATGSDTQGRDLSGGKTIADGVNADNVGAQIRDEDEGTSWIGEDLVRVGSFLTVWVGAGLRELESFLSDEGEGRGIRRVPGREGRARAGRRSVFLRIPLAY